MGNRKKSEAQKAPVTLKTVADHLGLSSGTVSLVLNNAPQSIAIPQKTKDRVIAAARELDYQPNLLARALRTRQIEGSGAASDMGKADGALMFIGAGNLQRAIRAIREAGLSVPGDVSFVSSRTDLSRMYAGAE